MVMWVRRRLMWLAGRHVRSAALVTLGATLLLQACSEPEPPREAPEPGYVLHDERTVDRFLVRRWIRQDSPEISPAGYCECITLVYEGDRLVLDLGTDAGITQVASADTDVDDDGLSELVVTRFSGGAHCCTATTIYSVGTTLRELLSLNTGHCPGRLVDLNGDGVAEFETCDDTFAYEFCAFASSPMPAVVLAYDAAAGVFAVATPRYAEFYADPRAQALADAQETLAGNADAPDIARCAALGPALSLVYAGRTSDGIALFEQLYNSSDGPDVVQKAVALARGSALWSGL